MPSDPPPRLTHVDSGPITYTDEGEGPVVVLLHGLPGSTRDWRHLAPHLVGVRVLRMDLPGFGGTSRQGRRRWTVQERAALVLAWLDALGVSRATVVGHSMGGPVAVAVATAARERVVALGLVASPGLRPHRFFERSGVARLSRLLVLPGAATALSAPLRAGFRRAGFPRDTPASALVAATADAGIVDFDAHAARVRGLRCPTLVAWAEDDRLIEPAIAKELAAAAPEGPRLRWPTGGHNIQKTRADELGAALVALASGVS